jgi:hypothetical protein
VTVTGHLDEQRRAFADILKEYYDIVSFRRSEVTVGNSKSSRTHLLTILTLSNGSKPTSVGDQRDGEIYIMDLAGKEALQRPIKHPFINGSENTVANKVANTAVSTNNALTNGINTNLDWLIQWIKLKKRGHVIATEKGKFVEPQDVFTRDYLPEKGTNHPHKNPLFTLTRKLWEDKDSKIMMIACSFPFASKGEMPFNLNEYENGDHTSVLIEFTFVLKKPPQTAAWLENSSDGRRLTALVSSHFSVELKIEHLQTIGTAMTVRMPLSFQTKKEAKERMTPLDAKAIFFEREMQNTNLFSDLKVNDPIHPKPDGWRKTLDLSEDSVTKLERDIGILEQMSSIQKTKLVP